MQRHLFRTVTAAITSMVLAFQAMAQQGDGDAGLADLSLEQLSRVRVFSVTKRGETLADAAAAVYVISREDIRRSGAATLAEALRLAPNLHVARLNADEYAISARGHNAALANKLLVQIDGRSLYTPLFSGVFWDVQDFMLADVERIEVISGPGATLWGSNAVNGIINVVTRHASLTQGSHVEASAGDALSSVAARHGGELANGEGAWRIYARHLRHQEGERPGGASLKDAWKRSQAGFRVDYGSDTRGAMLVGDAYAGTASRAASDRRNMQGANLVARWFQPTSSGGRQRLQLVYDGTWRDHPGSFSERLHVFELDYLHSVLLQPDHVLTFSSGYRHANDHFGNTATLAFLPPDRELYWGHFVVQDDYRFSNGTRMALGMRAEYNAFTRWEYLPSLRLSHRITDTGLLWGALSRSVRAPSRIDREFYVPGNPPYLLAGGADFDSEVSNTAEIGYRAQPTTAFSWSLTGFYHRFNRLRGFHTEGTSLVVDNSVQGHSYGVEGWGSYRLNPRWRFDAGFTTLHQRFEAEPGGITNSVGNDPEYQLQLRATADLTPATDLSLSVRHVSALPSPAVPAYTAVDARLGYKPAGGVEVYAAISNLLDDQHVEWDPASSAEFGRNVRIGLVVEF